MRRMYSEKQVEELARKEIQNKELNMHDNIGFDVNKGLVSGDNSIIVNSDNDDIVLDGATTITGDVTLEQDLDVAGDIACDTIKQSNPNNSVSFNFVATSSNLEITNVYNVCEEINSVLHIIVNIKVKNISENNVIFGYDYGQSPYISFLLPEDVASKIIDITGTSAHDVGVNSALICSIPALCIYSTIDTGTTETSNAFRLTLTNRSTINGVGAYLYSSERITLEPNEEIILMARMSLTLI